VFRSFRTIPFVMAGLVPAIHALPMREKTWMPATSAGMTVEQIDPTLI
jgi:hypothetical protein